MRQQSTDPDAAEMRDLLSRLAADPPPLGLTPVGAVSAGRRARRRRFALSAGGASVAAGLVTAAVLAAPSLLTGGHADRALTPAGPASAAPSADASRPQKPPSPDCRPPTAAELAAQRAYAARVRPLLVRVGGTLENAGLVPGTAVCGMPDSGVGMTWFMTRGGGVGEVSVWYVPAQPGLLRRRLAEPCPGGPATEYECRSRRVGGGLVVVQVKGTANGRSKGAGMGVEFVRPDDTTVTVTVVRLDGGRVPLTEVEAVAVATSPAART
jgi:hypothetical protein